MRTTICVLLIVLDIVAVGVVAANAMDSVLISGSTTILPLAEAGAEAFNDEQSK